MERILKISLFIIYIYSCHWNNNDIITYSFNEIAELDKEYTLPSSSPISGYYESVRYFEKNTFYLSDGHSGLIYRVDMTEKRFDMVGKSGKGPGEYNGADDFLLVSDTLFFNEKRGFRFQSINLKDNSSKQYDNYMQFPNCKFIKYKDLFYFIYGGTTNTPYYLIDNKGNKFFKTPDLFYKRKLSLPEMNIIERKGFLYFINQLEAKIFIFNTETKEESYKFIENIENSRDFSQDYNSEQNEDYFEKLKYTRFQSFNQCELDSSFFFIMETSVIECKSYLYFLDENLSLKFRVFLDNIFFITSYKNTFLFLKIDFDNEIYTFQQYQINTRK